MNKRGSFSPLELKMEMEAGRIDFFLDLRNRDEYESWRVQGRRPVPSLNIPQPDFVGEEEKYLEHLPSHKRIVTVCAHGDSSKYAAEYLRSRGYDALNLEGGMDAWSELYVTVRAKEAPHIYQLNRVARGCLAYLVVSGPQAVAIDVSRHLDPLLDLADSEHAQITHVIDTHIHADHISGGLELARRTGAAYHIHPADAVNVGYGFDALGEGQAIHFGAKHLNVIPGPGHTPGSTSFLLDGNVLFTGDTIMKSSIGRPDLGGQADAWGRMLYETLFTRFADLPDDILVLPAHSEPGVSEDDRGLVSLTLGEARKHLGLFQRRDPGTFLSEVQSTLQENPERYQEIRRVNLGMIHPDEARRKELEIGKNLCGMGQNRASS